MGKIKEVLIGLVLSGAVKFADKLISPEKIREYTKKALNELKELVVKTDNDYDDKAVLPIIANIEEAFGLVE